MGIIVVILDAIAALAGPASDVLRSLFKASQAFHAGSDATPDEIAGEAIGIAQQVMALEHDTMKQVENVAAALKASHSDMPAPVVFKNAAAAVAHIAATPAQ